MTQRQEQILNILQTHSTRIKREQICTKLEQLGYPILKRYLQDEIAVLEAEGHMIINTGGYQLVKTPDDLEKYEHSILTLYAHSESEREAADRKWALLQRKRVEIKRECRTELQHSLSL